MRLLCPYCFGRGYIENPTIFDIHKATDWQCGVKRAIEKERRNYSAEYWLGGWATTNKFADDDISDAYNWRGIKEYFKS